MQGAYVCMSLTENCAASGVNQSVTLHMSSTIGTQKGKYWHINKNREREEYYMIRLLLFISIEVEIRVHN